MGVPKRLTEMQRKFAELLVFGDNGKALTKTEAAKLAGFSPNRCRQEGYELTNPKIHPLVVDYIGKLREEKLQKYMVTFEGHIAPQNPGYSIVLRVFPWYRLRHCSGAHCMLVPTEQVQ